MSPTVHYETPVPEDDTKPSLRARLNGNAKWLGLALAVLGGGGGSTAWAVLRGEDPKVAELEAKLEEAKEKRIENIEGDVKALKDGFQRMDRNILLIGERVRAKGLDAGEDQ